MSERDMTRTHTCIAFALALVVAIAAAPHTSAETGPADAALETAAPLTLSQCVLIALERNPGLAASGQRVIGADAALTRARSPYYPQLTLGLVEAVANDPADGTERTEDASLVLRQTVWESGLRESVQESAARLESAEFGYASDVQSLVEQVATDYYGVLASDRLVEVAQAGVESSTRHLEEVQARIEVGVSAAVDEATAQDDLARAELSLIDARGLVRVARARLKTTMGLPQQTALELAPPPPVAEEDLPTLDQALATAERNRPDVRSSTAAVEASRKAARQAEIRRGPVADVSGLYDWGYLDWERRDPSWDLVLTLSWALFDGYARAADVDAARASLAQTEAQFQALLDQVGLEVESALTEVERARERVAATAKSVAAAEARLRAAEGKYQQGVGILLEVTDARAALTSAQADQIRAAYDYRTALVALERVLGTLPLPEDDLGQ